VLSLGDLIVIIITTARGFVKKKHSHRKQKEMPPAGGISGFGYLR
jgi:hypothetical protein